MSIHYDKKSVPGTETNMQRQCRPIKVLPSWEIEWFWSKVVKTETCWLWTGTCDINDGYGIPVIDGKSYKAHRVAMFLQTGEDRMDQCVLHHCDNPACVR